MRVAAKFARRACLLCLAVATAPCLAGGDVYVHVDKVSGMVVVNNIPPAAPAAQLPTRAFQGKAQATPAGFARVSAARQRDMDADRRAILEQELDEERHALAGAHAAHAASDVLARHVANVAALQRELARLAGTPSERH
jgi:hypothetical protein